MSQKANPIGFAFLIYLNYDLHESVSFNLGLSIYKRSQLGNSAIGVTISLNAIVFLSLRDVSVRPTAPLGWIANGLLICSFTATITFKAIGRISATYRR